MTTIVCHSESVPSDNEEPARNLAGLHCMQDVLCRRYPLAWAWIRQSASSDTIKRLLPSVEMTRRVETTGREKRQEGRNDRKGETTGREKRQEGRNDKKRMAKV